MAQQQGKRGLSSDMMALVNSDRGAMRSLCIKVALITSDCGRYKLVRPTGAERLGAARMEAAAERQRLGALVDELFAEYDRPAAGRLGPDQVASLLSDMNGGRPVTQTELDFVLRCADAGHMEDGSLNRDELKPAVMVWAALRNDQDAVAARFAALLQADSANPGALEVEKLLTELNDGIRVTVREHSLQHCVNYGRLWRDKRARGPDQRRGRQTK